MHEFFFFNDLLNFIEEHFCKKLTTDSFKIKHRMPHYANVLKCLILTTLICIHLNKQIVGQDRLEQETNLYVVKV